MQDDLTDLIVRVEAGTAEQQRELLCQAFEVCFPCPDDGPIPSLSRAPTTWFKWIIRYDRFSFMLRANAFESAALMMVPDDCLAMARTIWVNANHPMMDKAGYASLDRYFQDNGLFWKENFTTIASTPALALTAANLRARVADDAR